MTQQLQETLDRAAVLAHNRPAVQEQGERPVSSSTETSGRCSKSSSEPNSTERSQPTPSVACRARGLPSYPVPVQPKPRHRAIAYLIRRS